MSEADNPYQNIINARKSIKLLANLVDAVSSPLQEKTIRYGKLSLNTTSGLMKYSDRKPMILRKSSRTYPLVHTLILNGGNETTYDDLAIVSNATNSKEFQVKIRSTVKELR
ncbi:hypothetical protein CO179_01635, partial [candidate division WWE3 bacterium CG_4_9_14_3_um_filter_39_7]